jgi:hypothetical protein
VQHNDSKGAVIVGNEMSLDEQFDANWASLLSAYALASSLLALHTFVATVSVPVLALVQVPVREQVQERVLHTVSEPQPILERE